MPSLKDYSDYQSILEHLEHPIFLTDSRQLTQPSQTIFFGFKGNFQDGHAFMPQLYKLGVRWFVGEENCPLLPQTDLHYFKVASVLTSLQMFSQIHRSKFKYPVVAITGSNGKTMIKEWLDQLLASDYKLIKNPKSYNSQVGVPLAVGMMRPGHTLAVFEAGISKPNEMVKLQQILQPDVGVFTNIGSAHDAFFKNRAQKISEKLKLFKQAKVLIYCKDHTPIDRAVSKLNVRRLSWGVNNPQADLNFKKATSFELDSHPFDLPFSNQAAVENSLHCIAVLIYLGYRMSDIAVRIQGLKDVERRLNVKKGLNNCLLIDDTYNNDLAGLKIALDFLLQYKQNKRPTFIFSDLLEDRNAPQDLYKTLNDLFTRRKLKRIVGIGREVYRHQHLFKIQEARFFQTTADFFKAKIAFNDEAILVKGARIFQLERIVDHLKARRHQTHLTIDLDALRHNLLFFKSQLRPETKIMVMVKAFAYGNGAKEVAHFLQNQGVDYLGVAYIDEAISLRESGIQLPIMVAQPALDSFKDLANYNLEPQIHNLKTLKNLTKALKIHLKFDTGMHRLGFDIQQVEQIISFLKTHPNLKVSGINSHLSSADLPNEDAYTHQQIQIFETIIARFKTALDYPFLAHILNTAGILRFSNSQADMVRLGIGLYGISPLPTFSDHLQNVATLKSYISQIKNFKAGATLGYGRRGRLTKDSQIAVVAVGYADGFARAFSNMSKVAVVKNHLVDVVGNVCMDMVLVDVTGLNVQTYDEVLLFGPEPISWAKQAQKVGTIPYELLSQINRRVPRVFYTA